MIVLVSWPPDRGISSHLDLGRLPPRLCTALQPRAFRAEEYVIPGTLSGLDTPGRDDYLPAVICILHLGFFGGLPTRALTRSGGLWRFFLPPTSPF